jgi:hypothetical protein
MEKKPKSFWKKSFAGRTALITWLVVTVFAVALGCYIRALANYNGPMSDWLLNVGIFAGGFLAVCLVLVYVVWPLLRWLFWKHWRRTFFTLACLVTLIALFYAEEDWRGKHDWEKFKREWEAKGEHFDFASVIPPPVPDDQNFAFSPVWIAEEKYLFQNTIERAKAWYGDRIYSEAVAKIFPLLPVSTSTVVGTNMWSFPSPPGNSGDWTSSRVSDLKPLQLYYRNLGKTNPAAGIIIAPQPQSPAQDVLLALSKFDPVIEQLRQDSILPGSRFPIQYEGMPAAILLPHLAAEKRYAQVLQLRAIAELQNGESEKALADVKLMMRLTDASRTEPFLISHLVRIAVLQITLQPIYEGLAEHKWSDAQLADLDSELAKPDFLADFQFAIRGERAFEIANIEYLRHPTKNPEFKRPRLYFIAPFVYLMQAFADLSGSGGGENFQLGFPMFALSFGPSGWLDQNELRLARFNLKWYLPIVEPETKTISPAKVRAADHEIHQEIRHRTPENILETLFMPNSGAEKFARAQSFADLARVAIALERYRLAHGEFPESLDALAPQFMGKIPHDVIGGGPLKYRRTSDGQFVLYSVGWNETDDGGVVVLKKKSLAYESSSGVDTDQGDWVWRYPQK